MRTPTLYCDDGSEIELPFKFAICSDCQGHGKSSSYLGAYTQEEMDAQGPEFFEDYMDGVYDRRCDACDGTGKVKVADRSRISKDNWREWIIQHRAEAEADAESAHERRQLGGW